MNILIAGGTGFIGHYLIPALMEKGHAITVLGRKENKIRIKFGNQVSVLSWEALTQISPNDFDAVINLVGENIGESYWTQQTKERIKQSRISATKTLIQWGSQVTHPLHFYNASAIGIYGLQPTQKNLPPALTESTNIDWGRPTDFLSEVGQSWEQAALESTNAFLQITFLRFAPVIKKGEGMLKRMMLPFTLGLGGKIGSGEQPFSWIHIEDAVRAIVFLLKNPAMTGPVNLCSPECVTQNQFAQALAKSMNRPAFFNMPAWLVKLIFGQMGDELLLSGQHVFPERLIKANFNFLYPNIVVAVSAP